MAIRAGGGEFEIKSSRLAMKCVTVTRGLLFMTLAAVGNHLQIEIAQTYRRFEMRNSSVTCRTRWGLWISPTKSGAVATELIVGYFV